MTSSSDLMPGIDVREIGTYTTAPATTYERPRDAIHCEIAWVTEGTSTLTCQGETYALLPRTAVLTRPGMAATYSWDRDGVSRGRYALFATRVALGDDWPIVRRLAADDVVLALLNHSVWLEAERPVDWEGCVRDALTYALRAYRTGASGTNGSSDHPLPEPIERCMTLVRARWSGGGPLRTPSLEELAEAAAVSREHLCRVFKRELGCGPATALRLLRLRHAASMLDRTNLTVGRVAHTAGFESQFHFSRAFKQHFQLSPTEFRITEGAQAPLPDAIRRLALYL